MYVNSSEENFKKIFDMAKSMQNLNENIEPLKNFGKTNFDEFDYIIEEVAQRPLP